MTTEVFNPTQTYMTGILHGLLIGKNSGFVKIVSMDNLTPASFEILFASGLRLAVKVEVVEDPKPE